MLVNRRLFYLSERTQHFKLYELCIVFNSAVFVLIIKTGLESVELCRFSPACVPGVGVQSSRRNFTFAPLRTGKHDATRVGREMQREGHGTTARAQR